MMSNKEMPVGNNFEYNMQRVKEISVMIGGYLDFLYDSLYIQSMKETGQAYPEADWLEIEKRFTRLPELLSELARRPGVEFVPDSNMLHLLRNSAIAYSMLVEKRIKKKARTDESGKQVIDLDALNDDDRVVFSKFKESWDSLLYYLDFLESGENEKLLIEECATHEGCLVGYGRFYVNTTEIDDKEFSRSEKLHEKKLPTECRSRIDHINFFSRLDEFKTGVAGLNGTDKIVEPITKSNFQEIFDSLPENEKLLRNEIYDYYFIQKPETEKAEFKNY